MKVVQYPNANLRDAPAVLRAIADQVERGDFGDVGEVAVVLAGDSLNVFGFGKRQDTTSTHYMLCCASRKLEDHWIGEDKP